VTQPLFVRVDEGLWADARVVTPPVPDEDGHRLQLMNSASEHMTLTLTPWNHAPRILPLDLFEELRIGYAHMMGAQHRYIIDALSHKRLDSCSQCVPISIISQSDRPSTSGISAVRDHVSLAHWLMQVHSDLAKGGVTVGAVQDKAATQVLKARLAAKRALREKAASASALGGAAPAHTAAAKIGLSAKTSVLLTAGPAQGKTCLTSQIICDIARLSDVVPIHIKIREMRKLLRADRSTFDASWNYVDAHLRAEHGSTSDTYRMLRQAMMARRVLIILDGLGVCP
jgi:hypothetical protein